jgi:hypothetical protein
MLHTILGRALPIANLKRLAIVSLLGATSFSIPAVGDDAGSVFARVNGQTLTKAMNDEFSQQVSLFHSDLLGENKPGVSLVEAALLAQEAERQGLDKSPRFTMRWALLAVSWQSAHFEEVCASTRRRRRGELMTPP